MNYKRLRLTKQAFNFISPNVSDCVTKDPVAFFQTQCTPTQRQIAGYAFAAANSCNNLYFSQGHIARKVGCTRETVNRLLLKLESHGVIASNYRHKTSNLYKVSSFFDDLNIRKSLKGIFSCFYWLPLALLLARELRSVDNCHTSNLYSYISKLNSSLSIYITGMIQRRVEERLAEVKRSVERRERKERLELRRRGMMKKKRIKAFNVTHRGMAKLASFPQEAREFAMAELREKGEAAKNPWALYVNMCIEYCKNAGLNIDWNLSYSMMRSLGPQHKDEPFLRADEPYFYEEIEVPLSSQYSVSPKAHGAYRTGSNGKYVTEPPKYPLFSQQDTGPIKIPRSLITPGGPTELPRERPPRETDEEMLANLKSSRGTGPSNAFLDSLIASLEKKIAG